jgi:hypothetical protein
MIDHASIMARSGRPRYPADRLMPAPDRPPLYPSCDAADPHVSEEIHFKTGVHMKNRGWSAYLALVALVWIPTDAAACAIAAGDEDDECAEFVWGYDENGVLVTGKRMGGTGEITESSAIDIGIDGGVASAGAEGGRSITYSYAAYELTTGEIVKLDCVTYEIVDFDD